MGRPSVLLSAVRSYPLLKKMGILQIVFFLTQANDIQSVNAIYSI